MSTDKRGSGAAPSFRISPVAVGCTLLIAASGAIAQQQPQQQPQQLETVTVTGIRKGIEDAISVKRNNDSIVEAISAEDVGKLPDTTIAEALARLPGVTSQRTKDGQASNIAIRGLSEDFTGYLLNGREQTSTGDSRAVDLSVYPAELIASATVYKTGDAALVGAGLAGTIDNKLIDPLAFGHRVIAASVEKIKTGLSLPVTGSGHRKSVAYIDQFADRKLGIALGFVKADGTTNELGTGGWGGATVAATDANGASLGNVQVPAPFGNGLDYKNRRVTDERTGAAAIVKFQPNKEFTSQLDLFYSKIDSQAKEARIQGSMGGPITNATVVNGVATKGTWQLAANCGISGSANCIIDRAESIFDNDKIKSVGWKNTLKLSDGWTTSLDLSQNSAKRIERDIEAYSSISTADTLSFDTTGSGTVQFKLGNPTAYTDRTKIFVRDQQGWSGVADPNVAGKNLAQAGYDKGPTVTDKVSAIRFDVTKDLDGSLFSSIQAGLNYTKRTKDRITDEGVLQSATNNGFDPFSFPSDAYVASNVGGTGINMLTFDPKADLWQGAVLVRKYNDDILSKTWTIAEKITTGYVKATIDTTWGGIPVRGNAGLQIVNTDQSSGGYRAAVGSGVTLTNPAVTLTTDGTKFTDVLPSLNLNGDLGSGNVVRFGLAEQTARPTLTDLRNSLAVAPITTVNSPLLGVYLGSAGNPHLKPYKAWALDLSYEKYFGKKAYVSAAVFYKKLDSYIVPQTNLAYDFTAVAQSLGLAANPKGNVGIFTQTVNGSGGNVHGFELSASMPFNMVTSWLDGFGAYASYSNTGSTVKMPDLLGLNPSMQVPLVGSMALPGLSKENAKLTLYFEKWGFSAFVADNYRSTYVGSVANDATGGYPTLRRIQGSSWVSAQVGYEIQAGTFKGLSFRLEGNNLNDPVYRQLKADGTVDSENKTGHTFIMKLSYKLQ
ncbi:TonB-dependent receptor [Roseateles saccharophilus]|uniref:Iron complex outermembrane receptor protein n=1 Tax=Roseateles saccharophilus TaxID=304 RepID=A0A4V2VRZ9_ROSSA|nr:TonB-dependent receptor [Roseateles saccharophilus]MDG0835013.1 TonB-dependent receptor [Roseateles saccharophilus]TCV00400.1 iron complex outermembrane receptor protein [Roseateles saccharophilus]